MRRGIRGLRPIMFGVLALVVALVGGAVTPAPAGAQGPSTELASADSGSGGGRELPTISADGSRVAFVGRGETNQGVWLRDRTTDTTYRLTTGSHFNPSISDDGTKLAYVVYGSTRPIYVIDITDPANPGPPVLASTAANGQAANGLSDFPNLSEDGRFVAFQSVASNLTPETPLPTSGGPNKVYVKDLQTGAIEMVSVDNSGAAQPGNGVKPDITPDGRYVAFASEAVLDTPDTVTVQRHGPGEEEEEETDTFQQIYVRDLNANTTTVASLNDDNELGNGSSALVFGPTISADGNLVAFESDATNLVPEDTNAHTDSFVRDLQADTTVRVSERAPFDEFGAFEPMSPARLLDTRTAGVPVGPGETITLQVAGVSGVPADAAAAALNVTVTEPTANSHLTVFPSGEAMPTASNLNYAPGDTIANAVTAKLGADGKVAIFNNLGSTHVVVDVNGWYDGSSVATGGGLHTAPPSRLLDTRTAGTKVGPSETIELAVVGEGAAPETATAVALNVTVTEPDALSYLTAFPTGEAQPLASNINFDPGETIPNSVIVKVGTDGKVSLYNNLGSTHIVVDLNGWFDGTLPGGGTTPVTPQRALDTRLAPSAPLVAGTAQDVVTIDVGDVPAMGVTSVILNVTAVSPSDASHITVFPTGVEMPLASSLNFAPGQTIPNQVIVQVGADGKVSFMLNAGTAHLVVDVFGWVSGVQVSEGGGGPAISADGTSVAFESMSSTLTDDDANGVKDVFVHTLATEAIERASVVDETAGGTEATGTRVDGHTGEVVPQINGADPVINADGQFVAFVSNGDLANDRPEGEEGEDSTEPATYVRTRY